MLKTCLRLSYCLFLLLAFACQKKPADPSGSMGFTLMNPGMTGVRFSNNILETIEENIYYSAYMFNGGGVAIADINNDGLQDLYFTGNQVPDKLYLNKGNFRFEDISAKAGIARFKGWKNGISMVDINGDGWLDIYVCRGDHNQDPSENTNLLFINQGDLSFLESAASYGLDDPGYSIASVFFDMDNDHDLDLYVANRPERFNKTFEQFEDEKAMGQKVSLHRLYRNEGNGKFTEVSEAAGITSRFGYGLHAIAGDLNGDGWQDLYVCNDFRWPDFYYENQKNGSFKEKIRDFSNHISFSSMGADLGDINNDELEDLFVVEMRPEDYKRSKTSMPPMNPFIYDTMATLGYHRQFMHNALMLNQGQGFYSEISQMAGVDKTDWSWAPLISDFDHDGLRDIYVTNGFRRDINDMDGDALVDSLVKNKHRFNSVNELFALFPSVKIANYMFRNEGGLKFRKVMSDWGLTENSYSNGAAVGDLDGDGDLDLVVNNLDGEAFIYRNNNPQNDKRIRVSCKGPVGNPQGIGALITAIAPGWHTAAEMRIQRGYLSCSEPYVHLGLGEINKLDSLMIRWPDGRTEVKISVKSGKDIVFKYEDAKPAISEIRQEPLGSFTDQTEDRFMPDFKHRENKHADFGVQILLPHRMSRLGPFLTVADANGDGLDDFFVGGAKDQAAALYIQGANGKFELSGKAAWEKDKGFEDMGAGFFDADGDGDRDLYVVSGGSEWPEGKAYQDRLYLNDGKGNFSRTALPIISSSGSCVLFLDVDGDGDPDVFRGGRQVPNKYPMSPSSYLLINEGGGKFTDATSEWLGKLSHSGMITSAVSLDLDTDAREDLIVAGEWMGIEVWRNTGKGFSKADASQYGLDQTEGWWNRILATDLDNDGAMDLIGGNLGENYKFHATAEKPFSVYAADFDQNKSLDIVLAKYDGDRLVPVRGKQCSQEQMPFIKSKFPSFRGFADAKLEDIYGGGLRNAMHLQAKEFRSLVWMNRGGKFERVLLPVQAQFSAVQGIVAKDFDSDGQKEIILAGNRFDTEVETTPADASIGLLLRWNGDEWIPVPRQKSGIFLPGNVRDVASIVVSGKDAILISSNNEPLRLLIRNP